MSEKFITDVRGWCTIDEEGNKSVTLETDQLEAGQHYQCVCIKRDGKYIKRLMEGSLHLLTDVTNDAISNNKKDYDSQLNQDGINLDFVHMLKSLGRFTGYFINSTSWDKQQLEDYDKMELTKRLEKVLFLLK
jgi:hypothetical protein